MSECGGSKFIFSLSGIYFSFIFDKDLDRQKPTVCVVIVSLSLSLISGCVFVSQHGVLQLIDSCTHLFFFFYTCQVRHETTVLTANFTQCSECSTLFIVLRPLWLMGWHRPGQVSSITCKYILFCYFLFSPRIVNYVFCFVFSVLFSVQTPVAAGLCLIATHFTPIPPAVGNKAECDHLLPPFFFYLYSIVNGTKTIYI